MAARSQEDIDAEKFEDARFTELTKRNRAGADLVSAIRAARVARTESGLDCNYDKNGGAVYATQQGLMAACHAREDAAAVLILQHKQLERLDRLHLFSKWVIGLLAILILATLTGCAVPLTPAAENVQLVTAAQKERCSRIKLITFNYRTGADKPGNAMKGALNEAAAAGADSFYIVSTAMDWSDGASVIGEALRCKNR